MIMRKNKNPYLPNDKLDSSSDSNSEGSLNVIVHSATQREESQWDYHKRQTFATEKDIGLIYGEDQKLVPLLFGPSLKCLGMFGYPVPIECNHVITTTDTSLHFHDDATKSDDVKTKPTEEEEEKTVSDFHPDLTSVTIVSQERLEDSDVQTVIPCPEEHELIAKQSDSDRTALHTTPQHADHDDEGVASLAATTTSPTTALEYTRNTQKPRNEPTTEDTHQRGRRWYAFLKTDRKACGTSLDYRLDNVRASQDESRLKRGSSVAENENLNASRRSPDYRKGHARRMRDETSQRRWESEDEDRDRDACRTAIQYRTGHARTPRGEPSQQKWITDPAERNGRNSSGTPQIFRRDHARRAKDELSQWSWESEVENQDMNAYRIPLDCRRNYARRPQDESRQKKWNSEAEETKRKKKKEEERNLPCPSCRRKKTLRRVVFAFLVALLTANVGRYLTVFTVTTTADKGLITSLIIALLYLTGLFIPLASYRPMSANLPGLLRLLQAYGATYRVRLNLRVVHRRLKLILVFGVLSQIVAFGVFALGIETFLPSFKMMLVPFHDMDGAWSCVVTALLVCANLLNMMSFSALGFLLICGTLLLMTEFRSVSAQMALFFPSQEVALLTRARQQFEDGAELLDSDQSTSDTSSRFDQSASWLESEQPASERFIQIDITRNNERRVDVIRNDERVDVTHNNERVDVTHNNERVDVTHNNERVDVTRKDERAFVTTSNNQRHDVRHNNEDSEGVQPEDYPEEALDRLCGQHQLLCAILRRLQGCLVHLISMTFMGSIPTFFVLIYGLRQTSIAGDEAALIGVVLIQTFMAIVTSTVLGILVNDHAHAVQEVIYAADWSQFSDRLLTKVQLFANRLGHCKIGYDVYGLFVIDRSTVLMVTGTLVTYTVVVIQFQQAEPAPCLSEANTTALS